MNLLPDTKVGAADWMLQAACRDMPTAVFFPGDGYHGGHIYTRAKKVCATCPVRLECDAYADQLPYGQAAYGCWGGITPRDRRTRASRARPTKFDYGENQCRICGIDYTRRTPNSVLCDNPECARENNLEAQRRFKRRGAA